MRVVVTGGAGFIGHNIAIYLYEKGFDVVVVDSFERASSIGVRRIVEAGLEIVRADVRNTEVISRIVRNADFVIHTAAYISVEESMTRPELYIENTQLYSYNHVYEIFVYLLTIPYFPYLSFPPLTIPILPLIIRLKIFSLKIIFLLFTSLYLKL